MAEPRTAYIACTDTPEKVKENKFVHLSHSVTLFLNPTEAIESERNFVGLKDDEKMFFYLYEVDLTQLDGVWPRVEYETYNGYELKWKCYYRGKLPVSALSHLTTVAIPLEPSPHSPENAKIPPTTKADGER